ATANDVACDESRRERLLSRPECLDEAIEALKTDPEPAARNDLAVAYYARARRDDQPADDLNAWDAADRAAESRLPQAFFNRALAEEALGLSADAIATWDAFLALDRSRW